MTNEEYRELLQRFDQEFRLPYGNVKIDKVWLASRDQEVECELCGWPKTSEDPKAPSLRIVYTIVNTDRYAMTANLGKRCIENYFKYLEEVTGRLHDDYENVFDVVRKKLKKLGKAKDAEPHRNTGEDIVDYILYHADCGMSADEEVEPPQLLNSIESIWEELRGMYSNYLYFRGEDIDDVREEDYL